MIVYVEAIDLHMMMNSCEFLRHVIINPVGDRLINSAHGQYGVEVAYGPAVLLCMVKLRSLDWRYQLRRASERFFGGGTVGGPGAYCPKVDKLAALYRVIHCGNLLCSKAMLSTAEAEDQMKAY